MSIRNCSGLCRRDEMTGEVWCPEYHGWVDRCPKTAAEETEENK